MTWKMAKDSLPYGGQRIRAVISYQGQEHEVEGYAMEKYPAYVIFDFYNGAGAEKIIKWMSLT